MRRAGWLPVLLGLFFLLEACEADIGGRDRVPEVREVPAYSIEDFLGTTTMLGSSFSPDGSKILVSTDASGVFNAYAVPVDGGDPVQLTNSTTDAIRAVSYFPRDERFLYTSDQGGNERTHIYVRELDGRVTDLTPGDELKASFAGWSRDLESFYIETNERDARYFDVYEVSADGYRRTLLYEDETGYQLADVSPDERYLAFTKIHNEQNTDIYLADRETGELILVTPHEDQIVFRAGSFSPDGASLLFTTNQGSEFQYLARYDLESGEREEIERHEWDVMYAELSWNGRYRVVAVNNDARTEIRVLDTDGDRLLALPEIPDADITGVTISRDERRMAFYASGDRFPRDLHLLDLETGAVDKLSDNLNPSIEGGDLVAGEVVRFASYDGVEIPGILYKPHPASPDNRVPALVWVHGGPGGQSRVGYRGLIQYLVNHGYAVYAINNRGSSGYGKTFFHMDDRKHGSADLDDCVASKRMLIDTGWVDPDRIGIIGGSYGGYMVLAALAFRPEEFRLGVDLFGVANWVRTLESIPPWWESFRQALYGEMGDPAVDGEHLHGISPLFHAGNIVRPLMVLQGANDPRVLKVESDEMVDAARANGATVEYIVFEDEGHGFRKKDNQLEGYRRILDFLDRHLDGERTPAEA